MHTFNICSAFAAAACLAAWAVDPSPTNSFTPTFRLTTKLGVDAGRGAEPLLQRDVYLREEFSMNIISFNTIFDVLKYKCIKDILVYSRTIYTYF